MGSNRRNPGDFVQRVESDTRLYVDELMRELERQQRLVGVTETERGHLEIQLRVVSEERDDLRAELQEMKLEHGGMNNERERLVHEYARISEQNSSLANLYVATYRLHGTIDHAEILEVIQEIVANLIGSEEVAIFEYSAGEEHLRLVASHGVDAAQLELLPIGHGRIGKAAEQRRIWTLPGQSGEYESPEELEETNQAESAEELETERGLSACVPLLVGDELVGVIAIFRLLEHKPGLEPLDSELIELLSSQAGVALYAARLCQSSRQCS